MNIYPNGIVAFFLKNENKTKQNKTLHLVCIQPGMGVFNLGLWMSGSGLRDLSRMSVQTC